MAMLQTKVKNGVVKGLRAGNQSISVFKGIPFAAPPVGKLRWRPPQPAEDWEGVYDAYEFSPIPVQFPDPLGSFMQRETSMLEFEQSEDCLYLNVWTPAQKPGERLPVIIWVYGGVYAKGCGNKNEIDGEGFAKRGIVFVSFNYRLNAFGLLAHPELTAESLYGSSGNYAIMDQIAAIKWVRENIDKFGGNPDNITIHGVSAGGNSVQCLTSSPLSRGDIRRAILQSPFGTGAEPHLQSLTLEEAYEVGKVFLKHLGVPDIASAREQPPDAILKAYQATMAIKTWLHAPFRSIADGYVLPKKNMETLWAAEHHDCDYMIGVTAAESEPQRVPLYDLDCFKRKVEDSFGDKADEFIAIYNVRTEADCLRYRSICSTDDQIALTEAFCKIQNIQGRKPAYAYLYTHVQPGDDGVNAPYHTSELFYIFETLNRNWRSYKGADFELSRTIADYWANFAKFGDPNGPGLPEWTPYIPTKPYVMELAPNGKMIRLPMNPARRFMRDYMIEGALRNRA